MVSSGGWSKGSSRMPSLEKLPFRKFCGHSGKSDIETLHNPIRVIVLILLSYFNSTRYKTVLYGSTI